MFTLVLAVLMGGMASAGQDYSRCAHSNGKACTDDRNAFASHHGGAYPAQYSQHHHRRHHHFWNKGHHHQAQNDRHREDR